MLHKSDLYRDALKGGEHLFSLSPPLLESYLSSLLKNAGETIEKYKLAADEVVAIRWYGQDGFPYVQQSLRRKPDPYLGAALAPPETFKSLVKACKRAFAKLPPLQLPPGTALFRGTNFLFDENLKPDYVYTDPAFVSTSKSSAVVAQRFPCRFLLKFINIPKDDPRWRDISSFTANSNESEVLCLPNTSFRVISRETSSDQVAVEVAGEVEMVNQEIITLEPISIN